MKDVIAKKVYGIEIDTMSDYYKFYWFALSYLSKLRDKILKDYMTCFRTSLSVLAPASVSVSANSALPKLSV